MTRRALLIVALSLLTVPGWAQGSPPLWYQGPATGTTFTGGTLTSPLLVSDGAPGAPGLAFASDPTVGWYRSGANEWTWVLGGSGRFIINSGGFTINSTGYKLGWSDTALYRDAANTLQLGADAATASAQVFKGADSTGSGTTGGNLTLKAGAGTSGNAQGGALILSGGANAGSGEAGAVAIADGGTKPTCDAARRGSIWYDAGGAGVADTFEVCAKAAADTYAWRALATIP